MVMGTQLLRPLLGRCSVRGVEKFPLEKAVNVTTKCKYKKPRLILTPIYFSSREDTNKTPLISVNDGGTLPASELEAFSVPEEVHFQKGRAFACMFP